MENLLIVSGPNLSDFIEDGAGGKSLMDSYVPEPTDTDRYWRAVNWGADSGDMDTRILQGEESVCYGFKSDGLLEPGFLSISEQYPELTFTLSWVQDETVGVVQWQGGQRVFSHV
jgi:hypothetical protein